MSRKTLIGMMCLTVVSACTVHGTLIFQDTYDDQEAGSGDGYPADYTFFGAGISDRGISSGDAVSSSNAAYMALDNGVTTWGAGCWKVVDGGAIDLTQGSLSIYMKRSAGTAGGVAFKLWDGDGNEYRTADADLFSITTGWTGYTQDVSDLTHQDAGTGPLNVTNITQYGLVFYKAGSGTDTITYDFDDFSGTAVPEPSVAILLLGGLGACLFLRNRNRS
jgi:hypothetical protein